MDQMLPSPGFSIPSIGTPLHQPEEDQQILPHAQQQQQLQPPPLHQMPMMATPQKSMPVYAPSGFTPQSMMQPQTPQNMMSPLVAPSSQLLPPPSMGPATPGPMTPMTPSSADPGILPQLQ
ncbi:unnamed protein product [Timema podura]|nr:unnamed protein product [Timema podura]